MGNYYSSLCGGGGGGCLAIMENKMESIGYIYIYTYILGVIQG